MGEIKPVFCSLARLYNCMVTKIFVDQFLLYFKQHCCATVEKIDDDDGFALDASWVC